MHSRSGLPEHLTWLTERGLLVPEDDKRGWHPGLSGSYEMPREVALALRGPDYLAPLRSRPEPPSTKQREITDVDRAATAAALRFADGADGR